MEQQLDTTLTESQINRIAKSITVEALREFYSKPENQKAYEDFVKAKYGNKK